MSIFIPSGCLFNLIAEVLFLENMANFIRVNPHLHVLASDGCFYWEGMFRVAPRRITKPLEEIFRHKVFKRLLSNGKITEDRLDIPMPWRHSLRNHSRASSRLGGVVPVHSRA